MSDRGEYRPIRRVLLDGRDFQQLSERANHLFVLLKINFGPSGLEVWYPDELVARLHRQSRVPADAVRKALDELEAAGWIAREDHLVWIKGQLEHDPHVKVTDAKHRTMLQRHVMGLPRLALVRAFICQHEAWFMGKEGPSEALRWAIEAPKTENREPRTEDRTPEQEPKGAAALVPAVRVVADDAPPPRDDPPPPKPKGEPAPWMGEVRRVWEDRYGGQPTKGVANTLRPLVAKHGAAEVVARFARYVARTDASFVNVPKFAATWGEWGEQADAPPPPAGEWVDGWMSDELERATRPSGTPRRVA